MKLFKSFKKKLKTSENIDLLAECKNGIEIEIAKEFRNEAIKIMELSSDDIRKEFIKYHNENNGNVCCLVIDKAKQILVKEGKMAMSENDNFGKPFML